MAVRPHIPWYLLAARSVLILGLALVFANWMYDAGRRFAGFDISASEEELSQLRGKLESAEDELIVLRKQVSGSESSLEIERSAQKKLSDQAHGLETDNARLKEEIAVLENLLAAEGKSGSAGPGVARLTVESVGDGIYKYRALLTAGGAPTEVNLLIVATMIQEGKAAMLNFPSSNDRDAQQQYRVALKAFSRHEGTFQVPPNAIVKEVEMRLLSKGAVVSAKKISL